MSIRYQDPDSLTSLGFPSVLRSFPRVSRLRRDRSMPWSFSGRGRSSMSNDSLLTKLQDAWRHGVGMTA